MSTQLRDLPPHLQDRYGYRPISRIVIAIGLACAVVAIAFGVYVAYHIGSPTVYYKLLTWSPVSPDHTSITFEIQRDASITTECELRVQNRDHVNVGYAIAVIPDGSTYDQVTYQVATNELGYAAEVLACAPAGELSSTLPSFPPDHPNPPQPWSGEQ